MSSAPIALTTKSSIRCTRTPISHHGSITSCAIGNIPTTACALTRPLPTSPHWNSSPVGKTIGERQSVTNLLDEYSDHQGRADRKGLAPTVIKRRDVTIVIGDPERCGGAEAEAP